MRVTLVHAHAIAPWYCTRSVPGKSCVVPRLCVRTQDAPWIMPHSWGCPFGTTANHALCHACVHTRPPHGVRARSALGNSRVVSRVCVHARDAPWIMPHRIHGAALFKSVAQSARHDSCTAQAGSMSWARKACGTSHCGATRCESHVMHAERAITCAMAHTC